MRDPNTTSMRLSLGISEVRVSDEGYGQVVEELPATAEEVVVEQLVERFGDAEAHWLESRLHA